MRTKKLTQMAMLSAVAIIIFVVEAQIPLPVAIPGMKLGLSNVVTLFALWTLGKKEAGLILLVRILLGNIVAGTFMMMLYSAVGGLLCLLLMMVMKPLFSEKQIWILSIFGAIAHNAGQLGTAVFVTSTPGLLLYAPVLLLSAIVTGFFTGQCAQAAILHMNKIR